MKRIILFMAILCSLSALAQTPRPYRIEGVAQRFSTALGIPVRASSFYNTSSDTAIVFFDPADTTVLHFKYKGVAKKLAASQIPWDSITGKPSNFATTYLLSNDVKDSIQTRVPYENANRNLILGNYRMSARTVMNDSILARILTGVGAYSSTGTKVFSFGNGGLAEATFFGFAGMDYNRSGSMTNLSFVPKLYPDSLHNLTVKKTDTTDILSKTIRTFGNQSGITGNKSFTNDITANTFIKATGTPAQLMVADGSTLDKTDIHIGAPTFDTTGRTLNIPTAGGGSYSVVIPRGTSSGAEGITALSSSRIGNLLTIAGDNGSTTTVSVRDADSASIVKFIDSTTFNAGRWLPNRSNDSIAALRALINTKGTGNGTVTNVTASGPLSSTGGATPNLTIATANGSTTGALSSTDWNTFNNKVSYTDALARAALSFSAGSGGYNSSTGVITIPTNTNQITNGAGFITLNDSTAINAGRWLPNRLADSIASIRALANTKGTGTVTSVAVSAGTGISVSGSPITGSGTINVVNTAPDQVVSLTAGTGISISGTYPNFTVTNSSPSGGGTVTSVGMSVPTGFSVSGSPITSSGTLGLSFASGYSLPTTAAQTLWDVAYNKRLSSASFTSSTLTLSLGDGSTVTTSVPTFNQNTTGSAATLSAVLASNLGGAGSISGILKANGSGVVSAAVAGTDYVVPSALSGYLPLSGGTLTGALSGTSLAMSGGGSFGNANINTWSFSSDYARFGHSSYNTTTNYGFLQRNNSEVFIEGSKTILNLNGSEVLIGTTTTDGTNKLIVNGGVKGDNFQITARSSSNALQFPDWRIYNTSGNNFAINNYTTDVFSISSTGAASFSSSVTAGAGTFDGLLTITNNNARNELLFSGNDFTNIYSTTTGGMQFGISNAASSGALEFLTANAVRLTIASTGSATFNNTVTASSFIRSGGTSSQTQMADGSVLTLQATTYTPTIAGVTNVTGVSNGQCTYTRVGNVVTVTGWADVTVTSNETNTELYITLPVASNFGTYEDLSGNGSFYVTGSGGNQAQIEADVANDRAKVRLYPYFGSGSGQKFQFIFQYRVI